MKKQHAQRRYIGNLSYPYSREPRNRSCRHPSVGAWRCARSVYPRASVLRCAVKTCFISPTNLEAPSALVSSATLACRPLSRTSRRVTCLSRVIFAKKPNPNVVRTLREMHPWVSPTTNCDLISRHRNRKKHLSRHHHIEAAFL